MPRKFLFVSLEGLIGDTAWSVAKEGHDVKLLHRQQGRNARLPTASSRSQTTGGATTDGPSVIVFDDVLGQGTTCAALRQEGKLVVGGTPYTDRLGGRSRVWPAGTPSGGRRDHPAGELHSFDDAIDFVRANPNRYVIKPSGEAQNMTSACCSSAKRRTVRTCCRCWRTTSSAWSDKIRAFSASAADRGRRGRNRRVLQRQ